MISEIIFFLILFVKNYLLISAFGLKYYEEIKSFFFIKSIQSMDFCFCSLLNLRIFFAEFNFSIPCYITSILVAIRRNVFQENFRTCDTVNFFKCRSTIINKQIYWKPKYGKVVLYQQDPNISKTFWWIPYLSFTKFG